jgi:hypothetical protein
MISLVPYIGKMFKISKIFNKVMLVLYVIIDKFINF